MYVITIFSLSQSCLSVNRIVLPKVSANFFSATSSNENVNKISFTKGTHVLYYNSNAYKLASILEKALGKEMVLPARKISNVEELLEAFPDVRDLLIDGTERPIQRPKDDEKQKELTDDEKAWNRIVSGFRVLVEHAIGGVKRFGIVSDKFRKHSDFID